MPSRGVGTVLLLVGSFMIMGFIGLALALALLVALEAGETRGYPR